jgi:Ca2+/Na+ antiporter
MLALGKSPDSIAWFYYIPFAFVWSLLFLKGQGFKKGEFNKNSKCTNTVIELIGTLSGFFWTSFVSGLLIDLLAFIGVITKLSPTYLALTIIGVGNALPDALITIQLAQSGKAQMGITGSYAG